MEMEVSAKSHRVSPPPYGESPEKVSIGGLPVSTLSMDNLIEWMVVDAPHRRGAGMQPVLLFDCNGHALSLSATDQNFHANLAKADLIHADGQVIVAASKLLTRRPIADRSATTDFFVQAVEPSASRNVSFYLLGGTDRVNAECAARIHAQTPGLTIAGRRHGYWDESEEDGVVDAINNSGADILWIGLGKPREQDFAVRNRHRLRTGWIVTCGGLFNFVTGDYSRAPGWMQRAGIEWIHRMATNPRHLGWRYLTTNPHALWLIWKRRNG